MPIQKYFSHIKAKTAKSKIGRRHIIYSLILIVVLFISAVYLVNLSPYKPSSSQIVYMRAKVLKVSPKHTNSGDQTVQVKVLDGQNKGKIMSIDRYYIVGDTNSERLPIGSQVLLIRDPTNRNQYFYLDRYRIPGVMVLLVVLLVLVVIVGRWRGITSAAGLIVSIGILSVFVLPRIIAGQPAFATCIEGSFMIAIASIFIAHGFNKRTSMAFVSTIATLVLIIGIAALAAYVTGVTGNPGASVITEQETSLIQYAPHHIDLEGLFLGGMVIASLGVLEDVTTGQAAAVDEIHKSNPKLSSRKLYKKGLSVGHEHIAALINTLGIVYVGIALPTVVLAALYSSNQPLIATLNDETIIEAVVRTIVPSIGLLLAVPLSTGLAAYVLPRWYQRK